MLAPKIKGFLWPYLLLTLVGFFDALYLTIEHFLNSAPQCVVTSGCETVLTSQYAEIYGIPIALFGALYYATLFLLSISFLNGGKKKIFRAAFFLNSLGFLATLGLLFIMTQVLEALCIYCLVSAGTTTLLFITGIGVIRLSRQIPEPNPLIGADDSDPA